MKKNRHVTSFLRGWRYFSSLYGMLKPILHISLEINHSQTLASFKKPEKTLNTNDYHNAD